VVRLVGKVVAGRLWWLPRLIGRGPRVQFLCQSDLSGTASLSAFRRDPASDGRSADMAKPSGPVVERHTWSGDRPSHHRPQLLGRALMIATRRSRRAKGGRGIRHRPCQADAGHDGLRARGKWIGAGLQQVLTARAQVVFISIGRQVPRTTALAREARFRPAGCREDRRTARRDQITDPPVQEPWLGASPAVRFGAAGIPAILRWARPRIAGRQVGGVRCARRTVSWSGQHR
jgi:hypothetical protein